MSAQFVDLGALAGLLSLFATFLWRVIANQRKDMNRRFDKQDQDMAELKSDVGELQIDMAVVKNDLSYIKPRSERMDANIVQIVRDVGRLEGEKRSSSPREKVGAGGS